MKTRNQKNDEKRQRRIKVAVSLFIVFLMVFSTIGFYFDSTGTTNRYNGHKISTLVDSAGNAYAYSTEIDGRDVMFYSLPQDTQAIPLPEFFVTRLRDSKSIVFLFDPEDNQTQYYDVIRFDVAAAIPEKPPAAAITHASSESQYQFPVLSCDAATSQYPILLLRVGPRLVTEENGCFIVQGTGQDFLLLRDRILYAYYGIQETEN